VRKVWAVIRREFVERVRTKWFWFSAIIGPVLSIGVIVFQVMQSMGGGVRHIAIVDSTSAGFGDRIVESLSATRFVANRVAARPGVIDSLTRLVSDKQLDGFLIVSDDITETGRAEYRAASLSMQTIEELQRTLNRLVVKARLEGKGVNPAVVDWAQIRIALDQKKIARGTTISESAGESFAVAWVMAILLFMAILVYGVNVMTSVLEEKTTRIIELVGAGSVSFFQFLIWAASFQLVIKLRVQIATLLGADPSLAAGLKLPHIPTPTLLVFFACFLGGFLLYSSMFAAVGAMSSNEQEARQAQLPVTYLLMISYISIIGLTNNPSSSFAKTLSLVPFTSPIATPVRWTSGGMSMGELIASLAILAVSIVAITWVASRIYRIGILMTGKRPTMKELVRWVRTA
jgi:ABC-2 type transport system permease protein